MYNHSSHVACPDNVTVIVNREEKFSTWCTAAGDMTIEIGSVYISLCHATSEQIRELAFHLSIAADEMDGRFNDEHRFTIADEIGGEG